jgi:hypothetical protein
MHFSRSVRGWLVSLATLSLLVSGCGISDYNTLMKRRLGSLRSSAKFKYLYGPTELPGTPISVRVPMIYSRSYRADSAHDDDGPVIRPERSQPPFLRLPSFKLCYESMTATGEAQLPHYCYLAAMPAKAGDADRIEGQFAAQLKKAFPASTPTWETVNADTPNGFSILWKKLRVEGDQPFFVKTPEKVEAKVMPGMFELWLHDAGNYIVLVAWRVPSAIQGQVTMPEIAEGQNATFPADSKLDLSMWPALTAGTVVKSEAPAAAP